VEGEDKELGKHVKVLNCYGSYADKKVFWEVLDAWGILKEPNFILGGN